MAKLTFDAVEQILVRLDVKDLIRYKCVCKSWLSLISTPRFVKAHLNHNIKRDRDNRQLGHRRILTRDITRCITGVRDRDRNNRRVRGRRVGLISRTEHESLEKCSSRLLIIGSSNGLVCISPRDVKLVVTNPLTRKQKKLRAPPYKLHTDAPGLIRGEVCWGFGYDSCADDYKVIAGFWKSHDDRMRTTFYALSLKSNTWKLIGEVRYRNIQQKTIIKSGILCGGALHWFMGDDYNKEVIISLDLSTDEFKEIPLPDIPDYDRDTYHLRVGVLEDCLCIYLGCFPSFPPVKTWVMKNNKWELYIDHCETKYDVAHFIPFKVDSKIICSLDGRTSEVPSGWNYISESVFVKSLVSPHLHKNDNYKRPLRNAKQGQGDTESVTSGKIRKRKRNRSKIVYSSSLKP